MDNFNKDQTIEEKLPGLLRAWIKDHQGVPGDTFVSIAPDSGNRKNFVIVNCPLKTLDFKDHRFNPRMPNKGKVNELIASISSLTLLTPLTCAYLEPSKNDESTDSEDTVVLLDGRHRFSALEQLRTDYPEWARDARIDIKIYYNLEKSDVHIIATYLNKTRKALAKGEYYKAIVDIYDSRHDEIVEKSGKEPTEEEIFKSINARDLADKNFDLSVGRIVGMTAFNEEQEGSWYPFVGLRQQDRIKSGDNEGDFCPLTAGNLATFLKHLCYSSFYTTNDGSRSIEITNVLQLGVLFKNIILKPVQSYDRANGTTVACKHWTLDALGKLIEEEFKDTLVNGFDADRSLMAHTEIRWDRFKSLLDEYYSIMKDQAEVINKYRDSMDKQDITEAAKIIKNAWSYQTQTDQILPNLREYLQGALPWLKK